MQASFAKHSTPMELHRSFGEEATCIATLLPQLLKLLQRPRHLSESQGCLQDFNKGWRAQHPPRCCLFLAPTIRRWLSVYLSRCLHLRKSKNLLSLPGSGVVAPKGWGGGTWNRNCPPLAPSLKPLYHLSRSQVP